MKDQTDVRVISKTVTTKQITRKMSTYAYETKNGIRSMYGSKRWEFTFGMYDVGKTRLGVDDNISEYQPFCTNSQ